MDLFGIGMAVRGAAQTYFRAARRNGRTTAMLDSLKDGDRVLFANKPEADRVLRLCRERGLRVECVVCAPKPLRIEEMLAKPRSLGRTLFDHSWLELYYDDVLEDAQRCIDRWQTTLSAERATMPESERGRLEAAKFW